MRAGGGGGHRRRAHGWPERDKLCGFVSGAAELAAAAMADKKRAGGEITLVLPRAIGRCELRRVPAAELEELARVAVGD